LSKKQKGCFVKKPGIPLPFTETGLKLPGGISYDF